MSRRKKILTGLLVTVIVVVIGGVVYATPLLQTATGYAAHNACAVRLLAGRDAAAPAEDLPPNPLVPLMRTTVDQSEGWARTSIAGLFSQTAWHTEGLGCTLAAERPDLTAPETLAVADDLPWPDGERVEESDSRDDSIDIGAVTAAVEQAFVEDDPDGRSVGTRAVVVVHDGRIVAEQYADGFDPSIPQLGWSMAKSVTNAMVGRLVTEGTVDVMDDRLEQGWLDDDRAAITIDDLLHMSSGLEWDETYSLGTPVTEMLYRQSDMAAYAAGLPLSHPVGAFQQYSSGTTNILCDVLADRVGAPSPLAHDLVFEPLGMGSAVLEQDGAGDPVCSSYLWATPRDWARFGLWFAQGGEWDGEQLLPTDWVDYSTQTRYSDGEDQGHAAHWWANQLPDARLVLDGLPADTFWASGHDGQRIFVIPSADLVVVRMGFTPEIDSEELGYDEWVGAIVGAVSG